MSETRETIDFANFYEIFGFVEFLKTHRRHGRQFFQFLRNFWDRRISLNASDAKKTIFPIFTKVWDPRIF